MSHLDPVSRPCAILLRLALILLLLTGFRGWPLPEPAQAVRLEQPLAGDATATGLGDEEDIPAPRFTQEQALAAPLAPADDPFGGIAGSNITEDEQKTLAIAVGDVDGDGDLDVMVGNYNQPNRLYLNNGTADPFDGVSGTDITTDADKTTSLALGDVDGDGDLDLVAGNDGQANRLYLNQGSGEPWTPGWAASNIVGSHIEKTFSVALGDMDGDGDLDLVAGNQNTPNRLYLNNGSGVPWTPSWTPGAITADAQPTMAMVLGDVDGDGDLDVVAGNAGSSGAVNCLYLNEGTGQPWTATWISSTITSDADVTRDVALGDVDGDGDLDVVAGNSAGGVNRLYLNGGTGEPWTPAWTGSDISADGDDTYAVALGDVNEDGSLDLVVGNMNVEANRLYLNGGTGTLFEGVSGSDITSDPHRTVTIALGDLDRDGDLDVVAGNGGVWTDQANRLYLNRNHMVCRAYTNGNYLNALAIEGNVVWAATSGGVVRWSRTDGSYVKYTTLDGLADNSALAVAIDGTGHKWFGTAHGVSEYDGTGWTTYTTADGLVDNYVSSVAVDEEGHEWFGTLHGVSEYDGTTWTTYTDADGLVYDNVLAISVDGDGHEWFGTSQGVSEYDGATWKTYTTADGLADNWINAIAGDGAGHKWFGTGAGASEYDGTSWTTYSSADGLADDQVFAIAIDEAGHKWFGTLNGVSDYDGTTWTTYTTADGLAGNWVWAIAFDGDGHQWIATLHDGLSEFDGATWTTYTTSDGLAHNSVHAIAIDRDGHKWFGTYGGGVSEFDGSDWTTYSSADGLASTYVQAVATEGDGRKWFGTQNGVSEYDGMAWTTHRSADGLAGDRVSAIAVDGAGHKWFGTEAGVSEYDDTTWTTYTASGGLVDDKVHAVAIDGGGHKWFGTEDGASQYDGTNWTTYTTAEGLADNWVSAIAFDMNGDGWFATAGGASVYDGATWTTYTTADGLAHNNLNTVTTDGAGYKWFGTYGSGASRYDGTTWTTYTTADGLGSNSIYAIAIDAGGHRWFGTQNGVSECSIESASGTADLTATKTNDSSGVSEAGDPWEWRITVANRGGADAVFTADQTILRDQLPGQDLAYGDVRVQNAGNVVDPGNIACSINDDVLACTAAGGSVTLLAWDSAFEVALTATASVVGTFANPRSGGICMVDPDDLLDEGEESNNDCGDTMVVTEPVEDEYRVYLPFVWH